MAKHRVAPEQKDLFGEFKFKYFDWSEDKALLMQEFIKNIKKVEREAGWRIILFVLFINMDL